MHFLLECPIYRVPRGEMVGTVLKEKPLFLQDTKKEQFVGLMSTANAGIVAKAVHNFFGIRAFLINKPKQPL